MIFDLDGTLFQTERIKALSYARTAAERSPHEISADLVLDAFKEVVGLPGQEVAQTLVERFELQEKAAGRMVESGVSTPWQASIQVRLGYYERMPSDPRVLLDHRCPHNLQLLEESRKMKYQTSLATMSTCSQAQRVIEDSSAGVQAALAAGMWWIAVTNPFTRAAIHELELLDERRVVDDPERLLVVVQDLHAARN